MLIRSVVVSRSVAIAIILRKFCSSTSKKMPPRVIRVLNVAEKNDAAKSISSIMSGGHCNRKEGLSRFNKIYEFQHTIQNQACNMLMTSVSGHLLNHQFAQFIHRKWTSCRPLELFDAPVEKFCPENFIDIKRTLEREAARAQWLIIWTDCDREGENIGFEIINVCKDVQPNLRVLRARFSEITHAAITRAMNNLTEPDMRQNLAVDARSELDLRIGAAFTRFQTMRLRRVFPQVLEHQIISYGSCQFPTLGFVVERYKQVQRFLPETFYKIKVSHEKDDCKADFNWKRQRLFDHTACLILYEICMENPKATVVAVTNKDKNKWRPLPLDTVELEKQGSRKLRMTAKETMRIAEQLYQKGFISYPRTETNKFPKEFDLVGLVQHQVQSPEWGEFASNILNGAGPSPRQGNKTDNAHPPIHPIKYTHTLQGNDKRVYEFITRHFLACCSEDARGSETTADINIANELFTCSGLIVLARNYLDVYPYDKWADKSIPYYRQGETFDPTAIEMVDGETSPPPLLTEADLIALMDKHGIGTDATHADHIDKIKQRLYVGVRNDGRLVPGELGMGLIEGYDLMGFEISKPYLRSALESDLKKICDGQADKDVILAEQIAIYRQVFEEAIRKVTCLDQALGAYFGDTVQVNEDDLRPEDIPPVVRSCPKCGQAMVLKQILNNTGFMVSCTGFPNCRAAVFLTEGVESLTVSERQCNRCNGVNKLEFRFKRGSVPPMIPLEYEGCIGGCDNNINNLFNLSYLQNQNRPLNPTPDNGARNIATANPVNRAPARDNPRGGGANNPSGRGRGGAPRGRRSDKGQPPFPPGGDSGAAAVSVRATGDNCVVCSCNETAVLLTVKKNGPNCGRQFYKCKVSACDFFLWSDQDAGPQTSTATITNTDHQLRPPAPPATNRGSWNVSRDDTPASGANNNVQYECNCKQPAALRTVFKDGPNKGRPFYCCQKPRDTQCNFFQWGDEAAADSNQNNGSHGNKSRGNGPGTTGAKTQRKCGICHQPGHTRKKCPSQNL